MAPCAPISGNSCLASAAPHWYDTMLTSSMATANNAAFAAPAVPIANVATGMPLGICTIECSESTPLKWRLATGTPSTGTVVLAASMPGRRAAPPAPAMMAFSPRPAAASAYANMSSGMRWAETTRHSWATPNSARICAACCKVSQSLDDPIRTPTSTPDPGSACEMPGCDSTWDMALLCKARSADGGQSLGL